MPRQGSRVTLAPNLYADDRGITAVAKIGSRRKEKRFPLTAPLAKMTAWLERTRTELRRTSKQVRGIRGTLTDDICRRLLEIPDGPARNNARWELTAWIARFGTMARADIDTAMLKQQIATWQGAGVPASTINHRRRALAQLWDSFDGEEAPNPVRRTKRITDVLDAPTAWDMDALDAILDGMDEDRGRFVRAERRSPVRPLPHTNKSRARLKMLHATGIPPEGLMSLDPRRVAADLERGQFWYPPREKGRGAPGVLLELVQPRGVDAVREWLRARAWGRFSHGSLIKALRRAAKVYAVAEVAAGRTSPVPADTVTLRDLRDSFLSWLLVATAGDLYTVQLYGQHKDLETTKRYVRSAIPEQARRSVAKINQNAQNSWHGRLARPTEKRA